MIDLDPIQIPVHPDEKGYYDRQCPNEECEHLFKVKLTDWQDKFSDDSVYCPLCGHCAPSDQWYTEAQISTINEVAASAALGWIHDVLRADLKDINRKSKRNKFFSITFELNSRPETVILPIEQEDAWETEHTCSNCDATFSTVGNIYFCPCCGKDLLLDTFLEVLDTKQQQIKSLDSIEDACRESLGEDTAKKIRAQLEESTLNDLVSGFQAFAEKLYQRAGGGVVRKNLFQSLDNGSKEFSNLIGVPYEQIVHDEMPILRQLFQRRHLLQHSNGIVDEEYLKRSGDSSFRLGERIVVKDNELMSYSVAIKRLSLGLLRATSSL